jgi:lipoprotein-anchoring transpeptidase ErfK/SrfK
MRRLLLVLMILAVPGAALGSLAYADHTASEEIADGVSVAGIPVGGLTQAEAVARLRERYGTPAARPARVQVEARVFTVTPADAHVRIDLAGAVRRAYEAGRSGNVITRGWRAISGGEVDHDEPAPVKVDRDRLRGLVGQMHSKVARRPVDAALSIDVDRVSVTEAQPGRRLGGREDLVGRLAKALADPSADRDLRANVVEVPAAVTAEQIWDTDPTVVTVSREQRQVRVFDRGKLVKSYGVAVGEPKYPTPMGRFTVQTMQKDPPWNVPNSDWAGDLAGQTIPGGDPRNPLVARWIGFNGSVGFHGTKSLDSLGRAASHGCVRMSEGDVIDLFERVRTGTPVLVGA